MKRIFTAVRRRDLRKVLSVIHTVSPSAFFSVEDIRAAHAGVFQRSVRRGNEVTQFPQRAEEGMTRTYTERLFGPLNS
ncbi:DUF2179 domain-containing protein [Candidatus Caldatribacterium sp. SIUC1]|uniref:DUF2179 domain-containing protein n=1 Tax=Candidatus Caldatribacterium sp. SIUC1 TaxID=3418365 RepID=UPI003F68FCAF